MNKIYKVIYCKATQTWVAVSEITKSHGKGGVVSSRRRVDNLLSFGGRVKMLTLAVLIGLGFSQQVFAASGEGTPLHISNGDGTDCTQIEERYTILASGTVGAVEASNCSSYEVSDADSISGTDRVTIYANGGNGDIAVGGKMYIGMGLDVKNGATIDMGNNKVTKVADGALNATSTDAVNGRQLFEATQNYFHVNTTGVTQTGNATNLDSINGIGGAKGIDSLAAGGNAQASGVNAIAIGQNAKVLDNKIFLGNGTAVGANAISGPQSVAVGSEAQTSFVNKKGITKPVGKAVAIGYQSKGLKGLATAVGYQAEASEKGVAIGSDSHSGAFTYDITTNTYTFDRANKSVTQTTAIGDLALASGDQSTALGANTMATGNSSIAIGGDDLDKVASKAGTVLPKWGVAVADFNAAAALNDTDVAKKYQKLTGDILVHYENTKGNPLSGTYPAHDPVHNGPDGSPVRYKSTTSGAGGVAVGVSSTAADLATAFGTRANADGDASMALGVGSHATMDNSVAIGAGAKTDVAGTSQTGTTIDGIAYNWAGGIDIEEGDVVSFGSTTTKDPNDPSKTKSYERQLKNVAAGAVNETSTDAINGSQLHSMTSKLQSIASTGDKDMYFHINDGTAKNTKQVPKLDAHGVIVRDASGNPVMEDVVIGVTSSNKGKLNAMGGATGTNSLAAGVEAQAVSTGAIAVGHGAKATGEQSISIGTGNVVSGNNSGAIGDPSTITGSNSYSLGNNNNIAQDNTFVLGNSVTTTQANSVVLGNASTDRAAAAVNSATVGTATYSSFAGTASGIVSVGAQRKERQIINVAPGAISATSTDAINGSQLYSVAAGLDETSYVHVNDGNNGGTGNATTNSGRYDEAGGALGEKDIAIGIDATTDGTAEYQMAIGTGAKAIRGDGTIAIGVEATAAKNNAIAIGQESSAQYQRSISIGRGATSTEQYSVAVGDTTEAGEYAVAVGDDAKAAERGVAIGEDSVAATYTVALGEDANASALNSVALGNDSVANRAALTSPTTSSSQITGIGTGGASKTVYAHSSASTAAQTAITDTVKGSLGAVSVGNDTSTRQIINVAAGSEDTDAVNVAQLRAVAVSAGGFKIDADNRSGLTAADDVNSGETVTYTSGSGNIVTTVSDNKIDFELKDSITIGAASSANSNTAAANPITINSTAGTITGLTNTLPDVTGTSSTGSSAINTAATAGTAATVKDVLNSGWNLQGDSTAVDFVKAYDTVNFIDGKGTDAKVSINSTTGVNEVTFDVKTDGTTTKTVPVDPTDPSKGTQVVTATGGITTNTDGTVAGDTTNGTIATVTDVANAINNSGFKLDISGNTGTDTTTGAGFEFINPSDTVTIDGGDNITVSQNNGKITIATNAQSIAETAQLPVVYTDANGNKVYKYPDGKFYNVATGGTAANEVDPANIIASMQNADGTTKNPSTLANVAGNLQGAKAGTTAPTTTATAPTNVADISNNAATVGDVLNSGWNLKTTDKGDLDFVKAYDTVEFIDGTGTKVVSETDGTTSKIKFNVNTDGTTTKTVPVDPTDPSKGTQVVTATGGITTNTDGTVAGDTTNGTIATVGDVATAVNSAYWKVGNNGGTKVSEVSASDQVNFVNGTGTTSTVTDKGNGVTEVTFNVNAQSIAETAQLPVVYTKADGTKVYKHTDGKFYDAPNGGGNEVLTGDVIASMQNADGTTKKPTTLTNVAGNLDGANGNPAPTTAGTAPTNVAAISNNAATVGDVLNSGWNLQVGGNAVDFVKPYDTVNFASSNSSVTITPTTDGTTSQIDLKVNVDDSTIKVNSNGQLYTTVVNTNTQNTTSAGKNIVIKETNNSDGTKNYQIMTADDVEFDNVTINNGLTVANGATVNMGDNVVSGVADGVNDTDAVNVRQLNAVTGNVTTINNTVGDPTKTPDGLVTYDVSGQTATKNGTILETIENMNEGGIKYFHTNDSSGQTTGGAIANTDDSSASGSYSTAVGYQASSTADSAVAIGNNSNAGGISSIAIGKGAQATGNQSISIGTGNVVSGANSGAIGDPSIINGANSYSVGNTNTIATGNNGVFVLGNNVNVGAGNSGAVVLGDNSTVEAVHTGNYTVSGARDSQVAGRRGAGTQVVSVGSAGNERQIQNVAPGVVDANSTDAINGSQLYNSMANVNNNINSLYQAIGDTRDDAHAGTAAALAAANLPQPHDPGANMVSAAIGTYEGQSAVSIGVSAISDNGKWIIKGSLTHDTQDNTGAGIGIGYQW